MQSILPKIEEIVKRITDEYGVELVDIEMKGSPIPELRIFIDEPGGIIVKRVNKISREISYALEIADIIPNKYYLVVSSPGLDRPMHTRRDFERNLGERVRIKEKGGEVTEGRLEATFQDERGEFVVVVPNKKKPEVRIEIPLSNIRKGRVLIMP